MVAICGGKGAEGGVGVGIAKNGRCGRAVARFIRRRDGVGGGNLRRRRDDRFF